MGATFRCILLVSRFSGVGRSTAHALRPANYAKGAVPDLGAIVPKSTILSTEARGEAVGPAGAMPPQIFLHLQLLLENNGCTWGCDLGTSLGWFNEERRHRCNRNRWQLHRRSACAGR